MSAWFLDSELSTCCSSFWLGIQEDCDQYTLVLETIVQLGRTQNVAMQELV